MRPTYRELDSFTKAYIECALWSSTIDPFGECPHCGEPDKVLCRWDERGECVCEACSEREPNHEPPADENYGVEDLSDQCLAKFVDDCKCFQSENAEPIEQAGDDDQCGHDFWLTRNGHGAGYWDGDYDEELGDKLTEQAKKFGEVYLYVGDDGKLYC